MRLVDEQGKKLCQECYSSVNDEYDGKNVLMSNHEGGLTDITRVLSVFHKTATSILKEAEAKVEKIYCAPRWLVHRADSNSTINYRLVVRFTAEWKPTMCV